jgi:hypothetical protein
LRLENSFANSLPIPILAPVIKAYSLCRFIKSKKYKTM